MINHPNPQKFHGLLTALTDCLKKLVSNNADVIGAAIVSLEGMPIASTFSKDIDDALLGAMMAAVQSFAERSVRQLSRGALKSVLIEANEGNILISKAENGTILCVLTKPEPSLGMILLNVQSTCNEVSKMYARELSTEEIERAYRKILLIMKENNTSRLSLERTRLPEFFESNLLTNNQDGLPSFKLEVDLYLKENQVNVFYDKQKVSIQKFDN
ncbi:MAG: roadblock/LC7 domain-containing protein [Candidatus Lokiarchaeota archaeon]|nr:roadblock/LC7 domain-containing protein [Candidatus Lokiarchaeota archaeon]